MKYNNGANKEIWDGLEDERKYREDETKLIELKLFIN